MQNLRNLFGLKEEDNEKKISWDKKKENSHQEMTRLAL